MLLEIFYVFQCIAEMNILSKQTGAKLDLLFSKFSEKRIWVFAGCDAEKSTLKSKLSGILCHSAFFS